jgi:3-oxoacyl-[acyl-carrier protein] reductase
MYELSGRVALVTGASKKRALGRAIALRLAREGADVAVVSRFRAPEDFDPWDRDEGWHGIESLVTEIRGLGRRASAIIADVSNSRDVNDMATKVVEEFGKVDILVNNAGLIAKDLGWRDVVELNEETWNKALSVNLTGVFLMCRALGRQMIKQGQRGKIINIASIAGKLSNPGRAAYNVSKAGVISMTQTLARELAPYRINVNAVCPGMIVTWGTVGSAIHEATSRGLTEDQAVAAAYAKVYGASGLLQQIPWGRPGKVEEVASVVAFLASGESDYITGQAINVCGGWLMIR